MTETQWHAGPELLRRYADGTLDQVGQAAIETHVSACADCRLDAVPFARHEGLEQVWDRVAVSVSRPTPPRSARLLARLGVRETDVMVLRSSSNLVLALVAATVAAVGFALVAGQLNTSQQELFYLAIAPLLPTVLVAAAYDTTDPLRDLTETTPFSKLRVALLRTIVAVLGALPLVLVMSVVPTIDMLLATWLLPSLTLAVLTVTALTWWRAQLAGSAVSLVWVAAVVTVRAKGELAAFSGLTGQLTCLTVLLASGALLALRLELVPVRKARP